VNFASKAFFIFLPIVLLVYHWLPRRNSKYRFLLLASWIFYAWAVPYYFWVIIFTSVVDYAAGILIENASTPAGKRRWLLLSLVTNLGFLAAFKYTAFAVDNVLTLARALGWPDAPDWRLDILLPLGISFHTFQGISYTVDVYRGKIPAVRRFVDFALFVAFFPQLVAGPIVRAVEFLPQLVTPPRVTSSQVIEGLHWFLLGLFKKVFIADRLAQFVDIVFAHPGQYDPVTHVWAVLAYAGQIYCDFSGYSDLAIGCAKWFGFELPRNFNFPYLSDSIAEFWKRWHITLSTWMRDYLYISLGGSRQGSSRTYFNLLLTMTLCGLWHGSRWNYVLWGFYNGVLLVLHRLGDRALTGRAWADRLRAAPVYRLLTIVTTFWLVAIGLVMVRSQTWTGCLLVEQSLCGTAVTAVAPATAAAQRWLPAWVPLLVGLVAAGHAFSGLRDRRCGVLELPPLVRAGAYASAVFLIVAFGPGATKSFIYFQF